jgi:hypothetical protein
MQWSGIQHANKQDVGPAGNSVPTEMSAPEVFGGFVRVMSQRYTMDTPAGFADHVLQRSE